MKHANSIPYTGKLRGQFHADELAVLFFTQMTEGELFDLKHDMGCRWLMVLFLNNGLPSEAAMKWWKEPEIMQVWNLHWMNTDHRWIQPILHKVIEQERQEVYRDMHLVVFDETSDDYTILAMSIYRTMERINRNLKNEFKKMVPDFNNKKEVCHE